MIATKTQSVLVTGASSGIGLATARLLARSGFRVFAGARRPAESATENFTPIALDVTSAESIAAAVREIEAKLGGEGLAGLVNNAGVGDTWPLEFVPMEKFRGVFEVNVFGVLAVTQAMLPLLRKSRGRIVNIGSVGGMISLPFGGSLTASKHAVEALTDSLRMELWPAGIHVTLLQPASINSGSAEKIAAALEEVIAQLPEEGKHRYAETLRGFMKVTLEKEGAGSPPEVVAEAVLEALRADKPPIRRVVGKDGGMIKFLAKHVPDALRDMALRKVLMGNPEFGAGD
jgi:NAD(P)-dependent dehydrogenase (short-subunit alcohol dehydrogenase family)